MTTRLLVYVCAILLLLSGYGWWRASLAESALEQATQSAERAYALAKRRVADRRAAVDTIATTHRAAIAASNRAVADFLQTVQTVHDAPGETRGALTIVGVALPPADSVVTLGQYRLVVASAQSAVDSLLAERRIAQQRISLLQELVAAQDTALARADTVLVAERRLAQARVCRVAGVLPCPTRALSAVGGFLLAVVLFHH